MAGGGGEMGAGASFGGAEAGGGMLEGTTSMDTSGMSGGGAAQAGQGFDLNKMFTSDWASRAAMTMDPTSALAKLFDGGAEAGGTGLKMPSNMSEAAGPYAEMLAPKDGGGTGQGLRAPTREAATGLVAPPASAGGLAGYQPGTAKPLLPGLTPEQLKLLAGAAQMANKPEEVLRPPGAVAPPQGRALQQPGMMGMPGNPMQRATMAQLLYGR